MFWQSWTMCCHETTTLDLPAEVIEALAHYRRLRDRIGWDWGDEAMPDVFRWARFSLLGPFFDALERTGGDSAAAVRQLIGDEVPAGVVVVTVSESGALAARRGAARPVIAGHRRQIDVIVDSALDREISLVVAGQDVTVAPRGAAIVVTDVHDAFDLRFGEVRLEVTDAVRPCEAAELRLSASGCARWSVVDSTGGAWFPDGVLRKWDIHHRPFFHADTVTLAVPADDLRVACTRGLEFDRTEFEVRPEAGRTVTVECEPSRLIDPAADGWYGGDLHVHQNYSGDLVCHPLDAARMQAGEGLHLMNLVAGNFSGAHVYDREMLESFAGADLPFSSADAVARMGVEYRNNLLGHVHGLGVTAPPKRYFSGFDGTEHPDDWPPNKAACEELRSLSATVGYAHPSNSAFPDDWSTDRFFSFPRSVEARELVADAALGVVDSVDVLSPLMHEGAIFLYHRLLSCGIRLAATAGTDVFLSFSHGPVVASNPPGWARVYAKLDDEPLSVEAFQQAIRAGRTIVTNGPWLTFAVNGHGPGEVLELSSGDRLDMTAAVTGVGVEEMTIVGPDGVLASGAPGELAFTSTVDGPGWYAAIARGPGHPNTLDSSVLAHTSPVYVDVGGRRVGRLADARWCLDFLDTLQAFVAEHGNFAPSTRAERFGDLVAVLDDARTYYRSVLRTADR
ncbi:CehA/McbA family metallohydrolase [Fodinicola acaciae]|uniref:CehA/McbA family metallohydrolase n=1 Tax=Fodinicola acaciae TaxID=2681555 RepID=UPI0013D88F45|nr:CehA/McbA family metallohydrolase [Fodinicola acaciae]